MDEKRLVQDEAIRVWGKRLAGLASGRKGIAGGFWGPPGIGKSYCAEQVVSRLPFPVYRIHAAANPNHWLKALPEPKGLPSWAKAVMEQLDQYGYIDIPTLSSCLLAWLEALGPTVLYLEDLHEATPEQLKFWIALAQRIQQNRSVGLWATSRLPLPEPLEGITLEPHNPAESDALLQQEAGMLLPEEAPKWIYQRALGNPLFTLEYFRFLARAGYLWNDGRRWHWRSPPTDSLPGLVETLIAHHLQMVSLDSKARVLLVAKALLPYETPVSVLAAVSQLSSASLEEAQRELIAAGILQGEDFVHPLFREVFAKDLPLAERKAFAQRALKPLSQYPQWIAKLAMDAQLPPSEAVSLLRKAAKTAGKATLLAGRLLGQAAELSEGREKFELSLEAAQILTNHVPLEALQFAEVAYAQLPSPEAGLVLCELYLLHKRVEESKALFDRLPEPVRLSRRGLLFCLQYLSEIKDFKAVLELWHRHTSSLQKDVSAIQNVVYALRVSGDKEAAVDLVNRALQQAHWGAEQRSALYHARGNIHALNAEFEAAIADYSLALETYSDTSARASLLSNKAMMLTEVGAYSQAIEGLQEVLKIATEKGDLLRRAVAQQNLGYVFNTTLDFEKAEEVLLEAREVFMQLRILDRLTYTEANLSDIYREWPIAYAGARALRHARAALGLARQSNDSFLLSYTACVTAQAEAKFGDPNQALLLAQEAQRVAEAVGNALGIATALQAEGRALEALKRMNEAVEVFKLAIGRFEELNMPAMAQALQSALKNMTGAKEIRDSGIAEEKSKTPLEVLGTVRLNGKPVQAIKLQELLGYLVDIGLQGYSEASQLELLEKLYPDIPETEAKAALQQLVYRIRQNFGSSVILKTPSGYKLGIKTDAEEFLRTGDTRLWNSDIFSLVLSEASQARLYRKLFAAIEEILPLDAPEAVRAAKILRRLDPYNKEVLVLLLYCLQLNQDIDIKQLYSQARLEFAEVGESLPESYIALIEASRV